MKYKIVTNKNTKSILDNNNMANNCTMGCEYNDRTVGKQRDLL